jgi:hypothetical protein
VACVDTTLAPDRPAKWLVASDTAAIIIFVTIGLLSHHKGLTPRGYARDALSLLGGWFAAAIIFRTYRTHRTTRVLATWAVGITAGVIARALILGHAFNGNEAAFYGITLAFVLLFVYMLRSLVGVLTRP